MSKYIVLETSGASLTHREVNHAWHGDFLFNNSLFLNNIGHECGVLGFTLHFKIILLVSLQTSVAGPSFSHPATLLAAQSLAPLASSRLLLFPLYRVFPPSLNSSPCCQ